MRALLYLIFFLLITNFSFAQKLTETSIDEQTYTTFISGNYQETIKLGTKSLRQNIDFYYLRYRLGVSYFELKNYEKAIYHLEKAKAFDSNDPYMMEYLYYAYIYTNQTEKAYQLTAIFPDELKAKVNHKTPLFKSVAFETGLLQTNDLNNLKKVDLRNGYPTAQGTFYSDVAFGNLLITNQITPNFKLQNHFSYVSNTSETIVQDAVVNKFTDKNNYYQWNILGAYFHKGYKVGFGFGSYHSSYNTYSLATPPAPITINHYKNNNYSVSFSLSKKLTYIEPSISLSYTDISALKTLTAEAALTYFPFGNKNFYSNSKVAFVTNETYNNSIFTQMLGYKLTPKIWIEGFGAFGNHLNYISDNGLSVFNTPNQINWYTGSNLNFYIKRFDFSLGYGIQQRESNYYTADLSTLNTINYTYNYNLLKTRIVWKF